MTNAIDIEPQIHGSFGIRESSNINGPLRDVHTILHLYLTSANRRKAHEVNRLVLLSFLHTFCTLWGWHIGWWSEARYLHRLPTQLAYK